MEPPQITEQRQRGRARRDVAVVGASAGGVEALTSLVRGLSADTPVAMFVVLHLPAGARSRLADILTRAGPLPAEPARHSAPMETGKIVVAPPDYHLVLSGERSFLLDGPRENGFRPAIDPLFRSAARTLGPRATGIILSGTMDDGVAGLAAIRSFGGMTIVQDPADALAEGMPQSAVETVRPHHVLPATRIGALLDEVSRAEVPAEVFERVREVNGGEIASGDPSLIVDPMELRPHGVDIACPECGGALQEIQAGSISRFRCRTGHIYSPLTLLETKGTELEAALWAALRALEEESSVAGRLATRSRESGAPSAALRFERRQGDAAQRADVIREALHAIGRVSQEGPDEAVTSAEPGVVQA